MQGTIKLISKIEKLKAKCKQYSQEGQCLRRNLKAARASRDKWKAKMKSEKKQRQVLEQRVVFLGQKLARDEQTDMMLSARAERHSYSCVVMLLCIWIRQQGNCSLRSCAQIVAGLRLMLGLDLGQPSHTSIANWEKKIRLSSLVSRGGLQHELGRSAR